MGHRRGLHLRLAATVALALLGIAGHGHLIALARDTPMRVLFAVEALAGAGMLVAGLPLWRVPRMRLASAAFVASGATSLALLAALVLEPRPFGTLFLIAQGVAGLALLAVAHGGRGLGRTLDDAWTQARSRFVLVAAIAAGAALLLAAFGQRPGLTELCLGIAITLAVTAALTWLSIVGRLVHPSEDAVEAVFE
ncbi:MAG: hypothetical protein R3F60_15185 [bacterium]